MSKKVDWPILTGLLIVITFSGLVIGTAIAVARSIYPLGETQAFIAVVIFFAIIILVFRRP